MEKNSFVSIIIVNFNTKKLITACIDSIKKYVKQPHEVIVVDNGSSDGSVESLKKYKSVHLIKNKTNLGFAKANNQGLKIAKGDFVLLLNSDTLLNEDAITPSVKFLRENSQVGIVSCKLLNTDLSVQPTGGFFPTLPRILFWMLGLDDLPLINKAITHFHPKKEFYFANRSLDWVTGAFFLIKKKVIEEVGNLDEDYFMYVEEMDFCYRAKKKGWDVHFLSNPKIIHYGGASSKSNFAIENELKNQILFYKKHKSEFETKIVRILIKLGSLLRSVLYAIMGKSDQYETYLKLARSL